MSRYLDPKADVVFKRIFGDHPHLLKSFLNAVLPLSEDRQIAELSYLPHEQIPSIPVLKRTIADVKCTDIHGRVFIVEMQIEWTDCFRQRLLFEAGQAFVKQIEKGEQYHLLQPVYGLGIIADIFDHETSEWYHHYQLVNVGKPAREIIEHLQLVFIELPKFKVQTVDEKKLKLLWLRFLREINEKTKEIDAELLAVPEISKAIELSEQAAYSKGELQAYEDYWKAVRTEKTLIEGRYREGMQKMILQFVRVKFGHIPEGLGKRIKSMNPEALLTFSQQVFSAQSIDEMMEPYVEKSCAKNTDTVT